ncbi:MAG: enoyl-CoA hydratase/isomerase family protein [Leptospira sp.]|nr:enoyl-CoA hydratase/isomerase family protein [Leptospira sp.]
MSETRVIIENHIATIELNQPEKRNAISRALLRSLQENLLEVEGVQNLRALILTGTGDKAFCAGADLKERLSMTHEEVIEFLNSLRGTLRLIEKFRIPTIAAMNGDAYGGGLELALCCDFRIVANHILIGLTETGLGIIPGAGGTQRLSRLIGISKAKEMIFTAKKIDAGTALICGLANSMSMQAFLRADSLKFAEQIAASAPIAVALAKQAIDEGFGEEMETALDIERKLYLRTLDTKDRKEALVAFQEKRKPEFRGE